MKKLVIAAGKAAFAVVALVAFVALFLPNGLDPGGGAKANNVPVALVDTGQHLDNSANNANNIIGYAPATLVSNPNNNRVEQNVALNTPARENRAGPTSQTLVNSVNRANTTAWMTPQLQREVRAGPTGSSFVNGYSANSKAQNLIDAAAAVYKSMEKTNDIATIAKTRATTFLEAALSADFRQAPIQVAGTTCANANSA